MCDPRHTPIDGKTWAINIEKEIEQVAIANLLLSRAEMKSRSQNSD